MTKQHIHNQADLYFKHTDERCPVDFFNFVFENFGTEGIDLADFCEWDENK